MKLNVLFFMLLVPTLAAGVLAQAPDDQNSYLRWPQGQAESIGKSTYHDGKIGSRWLDTRGLKTERSLNYKLRATWFTPEVIRASARWAQIKDRLTDSETQALVAEAEAAGDTVIMIELDPNEGSGVIPLDWSAFLQPKGTTSSQDAVRGAKKPELRQVRALQGVLQRNYDYERFWVVFPLAGKDGHTLLDHKNEVELVVRIYDREGAVSWVIPPSIRALENSLNPASK